MRSAFHTAAWQTTAAQTAACIPDVAAGRADIGIIENFWQQDKKPEAARAAFVRYAFQDVCAKNDQASAAWLLQQYPAHLKIPDIKKAARAALHSGHDALAGFLADTIHAQQSAPDALRALDILLGDALEKSGVGMVAGLLQKMPQPGSALLYRAALGGRLDNAKCLVNFCKEQKTLVQDDLDRALVVAVKGGDIPLTQAFLAYGANPDACRKASMTRAAATEEAVRGTLLKMLLAAEADPLHAVEKFPPAYRDDIQAVAAAVQEKHRIRLQAETGASLTVESLRPYQKNLGMTGLHYAARYRLFKDISFDGLTKQDLLQTNALGQNLVDALVQAGGVDVLLAPDKWRGQRDVLAQFVALLPEKMQQDIALPALLHAVDMQTLKGRQQGLRLKPKGF